MSTIDQANATETIIDFAMTCGGNAGPDDAGPLALAVLLEEAPGEAPTADAAPEAAGGDAGEPPLAAAA